MSSVDHTQHSPSVAVVTSAIFLCTLLALPATTVTAANVFSSNALTDAPQQPRSALASKVIFHSPPLANMLNMYKDIIVSSKPLNLHKHAGGSKTKKTKKDSKIYYIPMPPLPYRYIPGVGYDYQPMKITPIVKEQPKVPNVAIVGVPISATTAKDQPQQPGYHAQRQPATGTHINKNKAEVSAGAASKNQIDRLGGDSKIFRIQRDDYYFNGLPFRLQVARAQPRNQLTPRNLKSKLYFNKKIIY